VLCVDEKPQIQAVEGTMPVLPMRPGQVERRSHDYRRLGTTDLFAALDVKTGGVIGTCKRQHRSEEFRAFLDQVEASVPGDLDVHLVLDNASSHKARLVQDWLVK
jgi:transposase